MSDLAEDRVYDAEGETTAVFVATAMGIVRVEVSGERVGRFGIDHRCVARAIAADRAVAVATDEDALVRDGGAFEPTDFGPALAVGFHGGRPVVAGEHGEIAVHEGDAWTDLGRLDADVRALDGDLVATDDGVYRVAEAGFDRLGLGDVYDVAAGETSLAATEAGLYALDGGPSHVLDGAFRTVAAGSSGVAHAATAGTLYERREGEWTAVDLPVEEAVVGVAYGECPYAVTAEGTLLTGDGEWRPHPLGVREAVGITVQ